MNLVDKNIEATLITENYCIFLIIIKYIIILSKYKIHIRI